MQPQDRIDDLARRMTAIPTRPGLRERVLARIDTGMPVGRRRELALGQGAARVVTGCLAAAAAFALALALRPDAVPSVPTADDVGAQDVGAVAGAVEGRMPAVSGVDRLPPRAPVAAETMASPDSSGAVGRQSAVEPSAFDEASVEIPRLPLLSAPEPIAMAAVVPDPVAIAPIAIEPVRTFRVVIDPLESTSVLYAPAAGAGL